MDKLTILIIEDNKLNAELAAGSLECAGYETIQANDAETGIQIAHSENPSLVIMDIALPGMDGISATKILKADPDTSGIPIVAVTAHAMNGDEKHARDAGCVGYITKPINIRTFASQITAFLTIGLN
jgi:CheY-like chemotaxis protein